MALRTWAKKAYYTSNPATYEQATCWGQQWMVGTGTERSVFSTTLFSWWPQIDNDMTWAKHEMEACSR